MFGGIGHTMLIFSTMLSFTGQPQFTSEAKLSILLAFNFAIILGVTNLNRVRKEITKEGSSGKVDIM